MGTVNNTCDPSWQSLHVELLSFTPVTATHDEYAAG
jgi:hypothetical protein